jgi:predicted TIM-barrel fold metal-dependent hydrolase
MNIEVRDRTPVSRVTPQKLKVADCDIHPRVKTMKDLYPWLEKRWQRHLETFGIISRQGYVGARAYPKIAPAASRRDAWPPTGFRPGTDLPFLREQLLDGCGVELGILNYAGETGQLFQNTDFGIAFCHATNHWLVEEWTSKEPRLKASINVPYEDPDAAIKEIELWAGNPNFVQVGFLSRSFELFGKRQYRKVFEAAAANNLPIGIHAFGFGGYPITGSGWPSYYLEEMVNHAQTAQSILTSMIVEGLFERVPTLRVVMVETGFGWIPSLGWRLDKIWKRLKEETPHIKRLPSDYLRQHVWVTTQPMEEPDPREDLLDTLEWIGWDKILYSSDYPHWDFDDPALALPLRIPEEKRNKIFLTNALELYGQA